MTDIQKKRLNDLFEMGLMFNGESYVGFKENNKDFIFHHTEIMFDNDEDWNEKFEDAKAELKRREEDL